MKYKKENYIDGLREHKESIIKDKTVSCRLTDIQYKKLKAITIKNDVSITEFFEYVIEETYKQLPKEKTSKRKRPSSMPKKKSSRSRS